MAVSYQQVDGGWAGNGNVLCSTATNFAAPRTDTLATTGGTPGTTTTSTGISSSGANSVNVQVKCSVASGTTWSAGTWTWRFNVTVANMNITLTDVYICRVNSFGGNQATIGSSTGLSVSMGTTGVKSGNITGSSQTPLAGDNVIIIFQFLNGAMSNQFFSVINDQIIDAPFTVVTRVPRPTSIGHPFIF